MTPDEKELGLSILERVWNYLNWRVEDEYLDDEARTIVSNLIWGFREGQN